MIISLSTETYFRPEDAIIVNLEFSGAVSRTVWWLFSSVQNQLALSQKIKFDKRSDIFKVLELTHQEYEVIPEFFEISVEISGYIIITLFASLNGDLHDFTWTGDITKC